MSLATYFDEIVTLDDIVSLCRVGLEHGTQATEWVEVTIRAAKALHQPPPYPTPEAHTKALKDAERVKARAEREAHRGYPSLYGLAIIKLWSLLEACVDDLVADAIRQRGPASFVALARIKGPLLDFISLSEDERIEVFLEKLKEATDAPLKKGCGRFESLLNTVDLGGAIPDIARKVLLELSEVRNVLVHRNARADRRFREACPWFGASAGEAISVQHNHFKMYTLAVSWYVQELDCRQDALAGNEISDDAIDCRQTTLDALTRMFASRSESVGPPPET